MKTQYLTILVVSFLILNTGCASLLKPLGAHSDDDSFRTQDVYLGMRTQDVKNTWGEPTRVQHAGGSDSQHQRWIYPTSYSYTGTQNARIVYFENGQVVGWETVGSYE